VRRRKHNKVKHNKVKHNKVKHNKVKHNKEKHNRVKILSVGKKQKLNEIYHVIMTENSFEGAVQ